MPALPAMPAGFSGSVVPQKTPSITPNVIPLEPRRHSANYRTGQSTHGASSKEPA